VTHVDTVIVEDDAAMQSDIAKRRWFINPLKPDLISLNNLPSCCVKAILP
jgi:hypothetical protein